MTIPARYTLTEAHFRIAELEQALRPFVDASYGYREDIGYPVWRITVSEAQYQEAREALAGPDNADSKEG